jgi:hypothetical protein
LPFDSVRRLVISVLDGFRARDYFQEAFGSECVDAGKVNGTVGVDPGAYFLRAIMRDNIWPYWEPDWSGIEGDFVPRDYEPDVTWESWDADTLLDVVEVMHDLVSKRMDGRHHDFNNCGWHYETFDHAAGQDASRQEINEVLRLHDPPYELNGDGEVIESGAEEFRTLLEAAVPPGTEDDLTTKMVVAVKRFQTRGASIDDRRHAVRDLADVVEALRTDMKATMLSADEGALFNIANNFAIRHHNRKQRGDYDRATWLRWTFYVYLATIHAVLRVRASPSGPA